MPRAALLSIHARVEGTSAGTWEDPAFVQIWGPRYHAYVIAARDLAVFTLGRLPEGARRRRAEMTAAKLEAVLAGGVKVAYGTAGRALGVDPNSLRYAAPTGTLLIRWDGARQPTLSRVAPPAVDLLHARLELARRYLHVFGPTSAAAFAGWAGIGSRLANVAFDRLRPELVPVRTPIGDAWSLASDEESLRAPPSGTAAVRLLPSGDTFYLLQGADRALLVPAAKERAALWTSRVWPGAILVDGEIVGTWRRSETSVSLEPWRRFSSRVREAVAAEVAGLPLARANAEARAGRTER